MIQSPYCGYEREFKFIKTWKYSLWDVYLYECSTCSNKFRYQADPEGKKKNFTIKIDAGGLKKMKYCILLKCLNIMHSEEVNISKQKISNLGLVYHNRLQFRKMFTAKNSFKG